jgi:hypothetical protein
MSTGEFVSSERFRLPEDTQMQHPPSLWCLLHHSVRRVMAELGRQQNIEGVLMTLVKYTDSQSVHIHTPYENLIAVVTVYETSRVDIRMYQTLRGVPKTIQASGVMSPEGFLNIKLRVYDAVSVLSGIIFEDSTLPVTEESGYVFVAMMRVFQQFTLMQQNVQHDVDMNGGSTKRAFDMDGSDHGSHAQRRRLF